MTDVKYAPAEHGIDPHRWILTSAGYAAAAAFCAVSLCANLRYGLSLAVDPIDKITFAVASVAADIFKVVAPLLVLKLWDKRFRILAVMGLVLWLACVTWSMASATGFVLSSRGEAIANRMAEAATRHGWEAKVERAETQLATLGRHRPIDVIKADLASIVVTPRTWRRSRHCTDLVLEESRVACASVLGLRKELAAAEAAMHLESQLVAGRAQLATVAVAGRVADPQAGALAQRTGADEASVRTWLALLLAVFIEVGSALGFTLVSVATAQNSPLPSAPAHAPSPTNTARRSSNARRASTKSSERRVQSVAQVGASHARHRPCAENNPPPASYAPGPETRRVADKEEPATVHSLDPWIRTRLKTDTNGRIPAREAYGDFCGWARTMDIKPGTETRFGRDFTTRITSLGGVKMKRRDRAYYYGVSLAAPDEPSREAA